jgi:predicted enzyme related to lactoylglutathione lyase
MRNLRSLALAATLLASFAIAPITWAQGPPTDSVAVGPQYDSTHVYVTADQLDPFVTAFVATFGGHASNPAVMDVTPTPSSTVFRAVTTPRGLLSVFAFKTPVPYPFGEERTGYLVTDMDAAVAAARKAGAEVVVAPFPDPIGRDAVIRWPGGVNMQLYWHTTPPSYAALMAVPENRVYVSSDQVDVFVRDFLAFSGGHVVTDDPSAPGVEIGRPKDTYRHIRLESAFGKMAVLVTDGHLPWPYGREMTGYEVTDLSATLAKAKAAGVEVLSGPYSSGGRNVAMVRFPGGYIAEIHASSR